MRNKLLLLVFVASLCAFAMLLTTTVSSQDHSPAQTPKTVYHDQPPVFPLPDTLKPEPFGQNEPAFVAYTLAAHIKETLYQVPCYCPCDKLKGHKSLLDCFVSDHGTHCHTCQQEAVFCFLHRRERPAQIRKRIADGEAWTVNLSKSAKVLSSLTGKTDPFAKDTSNSASCCVNAYPYRKEVKPMKYEKPTVTLLNSAIDAIQCESKQAPFADCDNGHSTPAYEADE